MALAERPRIINHGSTTDGVRHLFSVEPVKYTTARSVAERVVDWVFRDLRRTVPACRTSEVPLTLAGTAGEITASDVQKAVCDEFGIEPAQLRSERKGRSLSEPRMLAMWLARKYTKAPWSEIGEYFGRRSHSTVISAHRRVEKLISSQAQIGMADRSCNVEDAIRRLETAIRTA